MTRVSSRSNGNRLWEIYESFLVAIVSRAIRWMRKLSEQVYYDDSMREDGKFAQKGKNNRRTVTAPEGSQRQEKQKRKVYES